VQKRGDDRKLLALALKLDQRLGQFVHERVVLGV